MLPSKSLSSLGNQGFKAIRALLQVERCYLPCDCQYVPAVWPCHKGWFTASGSTPAYASCRLLKMGG
jgi:hypothetical protein